MLCFLDALLVENYGLVFLIPILENAILLVDAVDLAVVYRGIEHVILVRLHMLRGQLR